MPNDSAESLCTSTLRLLVSPKMLKRNLLRQWLEKNCGVSKRSGVNGGDSDFNFESADNR